MKIKISQEQNIDSSEDPFFSSREFFNTKNTNDYINTPNPGSHIENKKLFSVDKTSTFSDELIKDIRHFLYKRGLKEYDDFIFDNNNLYLDSCQVLLSYTLENILSKKENDPSTSDGNKNNEKFTEMLYSLYIKTNLPLEERRNMIFELRSFLLKCNFEEPRNFVLPNWTKNQQLGFDFVDLFFRGKEKILSYIYDFLKNNNVIEKKSDLIIHDSQNSSSVYYFNPFLKDDNKSELYNESLKKALGDHFNYIMLWPNKLGVNRFYKYFSEVDYIVKKVMKSFGLNSLQGISQNTSRKKSMVEINFLNDRENIDFDKLKKVLLSFGLIENRDFYIKNNKFFMNEFVSNFDTIILYLLHNKSNFKIEDFKIIKNESDNNYSKYWVNKLPESISEDVVNYDHTESSFIFVKSEDENSNERFIRDFATLICIKRLIQYGVDNFIADFNGNIAIPKDKSENGIRIIELNENQLNVNLFKEMAKESDLKKYIIEHFGENIYVDIVLLGNLKIKDELDKEFDSISYSYLPILTDENKNDIIKHIISNYNSIIDEANIKKSISELNIFKGYLSNFSFQKIENLEEFFNIASKRKIKLFNFIEYTSYYDDLYLLFTALNDGDFFKINSVFLEYLYNTSSSNDKSFSNIILSMTHNEISEFKKNAEFYHIEPSGVKVFDESLFNNFYKKVKENASNFTLELLKKCKNKVKVKYNKTLEEMYSKSSDLYKEAMKYDDPLYLFIKTSIKNFILQNFNESF